MNKTESTANIIQQIYKLNAAQSLPFESPVVSGVSNSSTLQCIPKPGASGKWCGSGYRDYFPSLQCKKEEDDGGPDELSEDEEKDEDPLMERFKDVEIIETRFRWGYTAE